MDPAVLLASDATVGIVIAAAVVVLGGAGYAVRLVGRRQGEESAASTKARSDQKGQEEADRSPVATLERPVEPAAPVEAAAAVEEPAPPEPEPEPEPEPAEPPTYRSRLGKARGLLSGYLGSVRSRSKIDAATWDDLEEALIRADVGVKATDSLLGGLRPRVKSGEIAGPDGLLDALKSELISMLSSADASLALPAPEEGPRNEGSPGTDGAAGTGEATQADGDGGPVDVWLFVGVNGVGKTTTVGKVANRMTMNGTKVLLAAGDTFRAAAGEQLAMWASRSGADIVRGSEGGDPSAVVFDAVQRAAARGHGVVLADTAGRLHNKVNLIEELKKIRRVADRPPGHVVEVLLVLDATTGQNGLTQAKVFLEAVEVTGVVLTKLDGTAKGGIVVAIQSELGLPVKLVGLGEGAADLIDFDPTAFVDALF
jgi:fused signal recognition particle receptor